MIQFDLGKYFTSDAIVRTLSSMPELKSPVLDSVYPEAKRRSHPLPTVSVADLQQPVSNIAVTRRGGDPVPVYEENGSITHIEPQPFRPSERLNGVDVNNLKLLDESGIQLLVNNKIDRLRRIVRASTEAMAAQSLKGSIAYPMAMDGGFATYGVDFGSTLSHTPEEVWNESSISLDDILADLIGMEAQIQNSSHYGSDIRFWAGQSAFMALAKIVQDTGNTSFTAMIDAKTINIAGFRVELMNSSYTDLATGSQVKVVDSQKLMAFAADAPFELVYSVIDDLDSNLTAMPFFVKQVRDPRSSSIEIIAESKPLPVPFTKGICWATVL
ncbi:major capsid protein [Seleniivibrio woodruffii]|uniref:Major capsid protein E n=1 Tax=Seleniivibrio woodruffii TaxID=1078050 RepID=A0A4R1K5A2_9BACT|nr:major capsid protein [Seleniivibrio woodruffii]TCK58199.1 major capsid protein E [Seleniivibrio woodruffii]TVZ35664.1 major capsid protein E [Seleniivibrio woodruffii]